MIDVNEKMECSGIKEEFPESWIPLKNLKRILFENNIMKDVSCLMKEKVKDFDVDLIHKLNEELIEQICLLFMDEDRRALLEEDLKDFISLIKRERENGCISRIRTIQGLIEELNKEKENPLMNYEHKMSLLIQKINYLFHYTENKLMVNIASECSSNIINKGEPRSSGIVNMVPNTPMMLSKIENVHEKDFYEVEESLKEKKSSNLCDVTQNGIEQVMNTNKENVLFGKSSIINRDIINLNNQTLTEENYSNEIGTNNEIENLIQNVLNINITSKEAREFNDYVNMCTGKKQQGKESINSQEGDNTIRNFWNRESKKENDFTESFKEKSENGSSLSNQKKNIENIEIHMCREHILVPNEDVEEEPDDLGKFLDTIGESIPNNTINIRKHFTCLNEFSDSKEDPNVESGNPSLFNEGIIKEEKESEEKIMEDAPNPIWNASNELYIKQEQTVTTEDKFVNEIEYEHPKYVPFNRKEEYEKEDDELLVCFDEEDTLSDYFENNEKFIERSNNELNKVLTQTESYEDLIRTGLGEKYNLMKLERTKDTNESGSSFVSLEKKSMHGLKQKQNNEKAFRDKKDNESIRGSGIMKRQPEQPFPKSSNYIHTGTKRKEEKNSVRVEKNQSSMQPNIERMFQKKEEKQRLKNWLNKISTREKEKHRKMLERQEEAKKKELRDCTFQPKLVTQLPIKWEERKMKMHTNSRYNVRRIDPSEFTSTREEDSGEGSFTERTKEFHNFQSEHKFITRKCDYDMHYYNSTNSEDRTLPYNEMDDYHEERSDHTYSCRDNWEPREEEEYKYIQNDRIMKDHRLEERDIDEWNHIEPSREMVDFKGTKVMKEQNNSSKPVVAERMDRNQMLYLKAQTHYENLERKRLQLKKQQEALINKNCTFHPSVNDKAQTKVWEVPKGYRETVERIQKAIKERKRVKDYLEKRVPINIETNRKKDVQPFSFDQGFYKVKIKPVFYETKIKISDNKIATLAIREDEDPLYIVDVFCKIHAIKNEDKKILYAFILDELKRIYLKE